MKNFHVVDHHDGEAADCEFGFPMVMVCLVLFKGTATTVTKKTIILSAMMTTSMMTGKMIDWK